MGTRPAVFDAHEDLQDRVLEDVELAIANVATEFCMREGSVPAYAARQLFGQIIVTNILAGIMFRTSVANGSAVARSLVAAAARGTENYRRHFPPSC